MKLFHRRAFGFFVLLLVYLSINRANPASQNIKRQRGCCCPLKNKRQRKSGVFAPKTPLYSFLSISFQFGQNIVRIGARDILFRCPLEAAEKGVGVDLAQIKAVLAEQ